MTRDRVTYAHLSLEDGGVDNLRHTKEFVSMRGSASKNVAKDVTRSLLTDRLKVAVSPITLQSKSDVTSTSKACVST